MARIPLKGPASKDSTPIAPLDNDVFVDEEGDELSLPSELDDLIDADHDIDPDILIEGGTETFNEHDKIIYDDEGCVVCPKDDLNCHELEEMMKLTDAKGERQLGENLFSYVCCWAYDGIDQADTSQILDVISLNFTL